MESPPTVSIVMPVYNTAVFLRDAVQSILDQTFEDFEFIIIDDGSSDGSLDVLRSFRDERIFLLSNGINRGLVFTLQRGMAAASGRYIARMDGDDIAVPERLQQQVDYLYAHPEADLVASCVALIDEDGHSIDDWKDDREHLSVASIRKFLPVNNAIAHPSILAKAEIIRNLGYRAEQRDAEDYDLWLRWASAGYTLHKLPQPLVMHRIRRGSFTRQRQRNVFLKLSAIKRRFLMHELKIGHVNGFVCRVALMSVTDTVKGLLKMAIGKKQMA